MAAAVTALRVVDDARALPRAASDEAWLQVLGGPAWLRVKGRDGSRTRIVSTLLHGNEPSGLRAIRQWLAAELVPAVDVAFYVGSVETALRPPLFSHRAAPGQRDANRAFHGPFDDEPGVRARAVLDQLAELAPEALVDVHNTTGHSPPYGVVTTVDPACLGLAALFADRCMHTDLRIGALLEACEGRLPAVVIECGRAGDPVADAVALAGLERFLDIERLEDGPGAEHVRVFERPLRVELRPEAGVAFANRPVEGVALTLLADLDRRNFAPLEPGDAIGWIGGDGAWPLVARGRDGRDVSREVFGRRGEVLVVEAEVTPVMVTIDPEMARADCLFYLMAERP